MCGAEFTAKDFRTWAGTVLAARALARVRPVANVRVARRNVAAAITVVAEQLRNTPSVCRKCYVHPAIVDAYLAGEAVPVGEERVLRFLERRLAKRKAA